MTGEVVVREAPCVTGKGPVTQEDAENCPDCAVLAAAAVGDDD